MRYTPPRRPHQYWSFFISSSIALLSFHHRKRAMIAKSFINEKRATNNVPESGRRETLSSVYYLALMVVCYWRLRLRHDSSLYTHFIHSSSWNHHGMYAFHAHHHHLSVCLYLLLHSVVPVTFPTPFVFWSHRRTSIFGKQQTNAASCCPALTSLQKHRKLHFLAFGFFRLLIQDKKD